VAGDNAVLFVDQHRVGEAKFAEIVWCKACQHQLEPDPAEMAARYVENGGPRSARAASLPVAVAGKPIWS
jgi:hypothetical protein